jgi:methanogenic corrinoid protein MtbC1
VQSTFDTTPLYNTAAVAQRSGVPVGTFHAWERRYGFPAPYRDEQGQRLYSERDVQAVRWLHEQTRQGVAVRRAVSMLRQGFAEVPARPESSPTEPDHLVDALLEALLAFNPARGHAVLGEAFALFSVEDACLAVLEPALVELGRRWANGDVCVAEEHYVSTFLRNRLTTLLQAFGGGPPRPLIVTACAPGETHELGILMVSLFLARAGFAVHYLGQNVPADRLEVPLARLRPALIVCSARGATTARALKDVDRALDRLGEARPELAYGGGVFREIPELCARVPGTFLGEDARAAVETVSDLLHGVQAAPALAR